MESNTQYAARLPPTSHTGSFRHQRELSENLSHRDEDRRPPSTKNFFHGNHCRIRVDHGHDRLRFHDRQQRKDRHHMILAGPIPRKPPPPWACQLQGLSHQRGIAVPSPASASLDHHDGFDGVGGSGEIVRFCSKASMIDGLLSRLTDNR